jgi:hypothetical protein
LVGGAVPGERLFPLTGDAERDFLDDVYMDRVFLSGTGLNAGRGAATLEFDEALALRAPGQPRYAGLSRPRSISTAVRTSASRIATSVP